MGFRTYAVFVFCLQLVDSMNCWGTVHDLLLSCIHHICLKEAINFVPWGDQLKWGWKTLLGSASISLWASHALMFSVCMSAKSRLSGAQTARFISASVLLQAMGMDGVFSFSSGIPRSVFLWRIYAGSTAENTYLLGTLGFLALKLNHRWARIVYSVFCLAVKGLHVIFYQNTWCFCGTVTEVDSV